jgi:retinol dehydrogenase-12
MPSLSEIKNMLVNQAFGSVPVPTTDFSGKTIIVTGANTGLGLECAKHLYAISHWLPRLYPQLTKRRRARLKLSNLILACRSTQRGEKAAADIFKETGCRGQTNIEVWELDLSNYESVVAFGARVRSQLPRLDGFISNAGMEVEKFELAEGVERTITVNVIATFLCAIAVLPKLQKTSSTHGTQTTLTFVGSMYHIFGPDNELDTPADADMFTALSQPETADMQWRYALSKLMVHQCLRELAPRVSSGNERNKCQVVANVVNPGWCATELGRAKKVSLFERVNSALVGWTAEKGSRNLVNAVAAGKDSHGRYLSECQIKLESAYMQSDRGDRIGRRMWKDLMARIEGISPEIAAFLR